MSELVKSVLAGCAGCWVSLLIQLHREIVQLAVGGGMEKEVIDTPTSFAKNTYHSLESKTQPSSSLCLITLFISALRAGTRSFTTRQQPASHHWGKGTGGIYLLWRAPQRSPLKLHLWLSRHFLSCWVWRVATRVLILSPVVPLSHL